MVTSAIQPTKPDDQIAQGGQVLWGMARADSGGVFAQGDIAGVVRGVLDISYTTPLIV